ncbi:MAG: hypothetical protein AAFX44_12140 [Pseudomonadota bacterium]
MFASGALASAPLTADEFDFELGAGFGASDFSDTSSNGFSFSDHTDTFSLVGRWYYDGLDDNGHPRSRAPFLDRTSSLSLTYVRTDQESVSGLPAPMFGPVSTTLISETEIEAIELGLRHVWPASGWFGLASYVRSDTDGTGQLIVDGEPPVIGSGSENASTYSLGVGKYLWTNTSVQFVVTEFDVGSIDAFSVDDGRAYDLSVSHVGSINDSWSFAVDASVSQFDFDFGGDADGYALAVSLLPGNALEFGVGYSNLELDDFNEDQIYDVFASWFVRENIEIRARYQDLDSQNSFFDTDGFDVGVNVRF